jgi:hypothetical protein
LQGPAGNVLILLILGGKVGDVIGGVLFAGHLRFGLDFCDASGCSGNHCSGSFWDNPAIILLCVKSKVILG